ncbi:hypothetical protein HW555_013205 [Spodoptera exigua]|uniref:Peptidase S1 domain-containing protein n=1 Tax=Spodoptera exigua TaxID=7107 RepID=A0A835KYC3_SPOEX|nr:hypothetical protein HW555_013205 [Spodoptera exigua]
MILPLSLDSTDSSKQLIDYQRIGQQRVQIQKSCIQTGSAGGVIIHERYILTSAACIEDAKHFYVVSGLSRHRADYKTNREKAKGKRTELCEKGWYSFQEKGNECIKNGAKKAVWKCVPKSYHYDGDDFDNIRWMVGDIAVVKVEDNFNFERRIRGCDFIPKKVYYNNHSAELEKASQFGTIAGWGTTDRFGDYYNHPHHKNNVRITENSPVLLETDVRLVSKKNCKRHWEPRYHFVIDEDMICTTDSTDSESMSTVCSNDHGGPLIVGQGKSSVVIGVMSACLTKDITKKCYGPFLFTSVYRYRNLITCAIEKDLGPTCRILLRSSKTPMIETSFDWSNHADGPAKDDHSVHKVRAEDVMLEDPKPTTRPPKAKAKPEKTATTAKLAVSTVT